MKNIRQFVIMHTLIECYMIVVLSVSQLSICSGQARFEITLTLHYYYTLFITLCNEEMQQTYERKDECL